jgi:hypothetical protein
VVLGESLTGFHGITTGAPTRIALLPDALAVVPSAN